MPTLTFRKNVSAMFPGGKTVAPAKLKAAALQSPGGLAASVSDSHVALTWADPNGPGVGYIVQRASGNGDFKSIDDLKKVPGIDPVKLEAKKDRLTF